MQKFAVPEPVWVVTSWIDPKGEPPGSWDLSAFLGPQFLFWSRVNNPRVRWRNYRWPCSLTAKVGRERAASGVGSIRRNGCKDSHRLAFNEESFSPDPGALRLLRQTLRLPTWSQHPLLIFFFLPQFRGNIQNIVFQSHNNHLYSELPLIYVWRGVWGEQKQQQPNN